MPTHQSDKTAYLACECPVDAQGLVVIYIEPTRHVRVPRKTRRRRCLSCRTLLDPGTLAGRFDCYRFARTDAERRRHCNRSIALAPMWMCEECFDLFLSLRQMRYCIRSLDAAPMRTMAREAAERAAAARARQSARTKRARVSQVEWNDAPYRNGATGARA